MSPWLAGLLAGFEPNASAADSTVSEGPWNEVGPAPGRQHVHSAPKHSSHPAPSSSRQSAAAAHPAGCHGSLQLSTGWPVPPQSTGTPSPSLCATTPALTRDVPCVCCSHSAAAVLPWPLCMHRRFTYTELAVCACLVGLLHQHGRGQLVCAQVRWAEVEAGAGAAGGGEVRGGGGCGQQLVCAQGVSCDLGSSGGWGWGWAVSAAPYVFGDAGEAQGWAWV